jgi:hypothetical protein
MKDFHAMDCSNQNPQTCDLKGAVSMDISVRQAARSRRS